MSLVFTALASGMGNDFRGLPLLRGTSAVHAGCGALGGGRCFLRFGSDCCSLGKAMLCRCLAPPSCIDKISASVTAKTRCQFYSLSSVFARIEVCFRMNRYHNFLPFVEGFMSSSVLSSSDSGMFAPSKSSEEESEDSAATSPTTATISVPFAP